MTTQIKTGIRTVGLRFDAHAVLFLCEMHGVDIGEQDKIDREEYFPSFVWCAYRSYMTNKNRTWHISYKKMRKILAKLRMSEYHKIDEAMRKAAPPRDKEGPGEDDSKKKQHGMTSSSLDGGPEYVKTIS
jgi:hypothetical protein